MRLLQDGVSTVDSARLEASLVFDPLKQSFAKRALVGWRASSSVIKGKSVCGGHCKAISKILGRTQTVQLIQT